MRERALPNNRAQQQDPLRYYGKLTKRMPNCGNCLRSELGNSDVNRGKDIARGAMDKLRGRFQVDVVMKRTAREPH